MDNKKASRELSLTYLLLTLTFCVCLIVSNLIEMKTMDLGGGFTLTAGVLIFPITYIINDCVVEVYGFARARLMIWMGFAVSIFVTIMLQLAIALPSSEQWTGQEAMETIYGGVPRIMAASFLAFLCGSMVNAYVMSRMKASSSASKSFSLRAILSSLLGESVDSLIFFPIAFLGIVPFDMVVMMMVTQVLLKTAYEVVILPVTRVAVRRLKRLENRDTVDRGISYKWWKISEI